MVRFVVADSSPLIGLATAGVFDAARRLFESLTITRLVKDEIEARAERPGARELDAAMRVGWIRVAPTPPATWRFEEIDAGEASTIALALEHDDALVLMDDALGRARAVALGLEVLDLTGVLLAAKRAAIIASVQPLVARLARRGFVIPDEARIGLLREAGEPAAVPRRRQRS
jgi:predicted nucleic acid-binding protein